MACQRLARGNHDRGAGATSAAGEEDQVDSSRPGWGAHPGRLPSSRHRFRQAVTAATKVLWAETVAKHSSAYAAMENGARLGAHQQQGRGDSEVDFPLPTKEVATDPWHAAWTCPLTPHR